MKKFNQQIFDICGKKFTLQDVFETACGYLSEGNERSIEESKYSCDAINWAIWSHLGFKDSSSRVAACCTGGDVARYLSIQGIIHEVMENLGFYYFDSLRVYDETVNPQQARFIWLTWLAMMAEEQGV